MSKERPPHADDTQAPFWFLGGRAQILVPGTATGGALSVMEFTDPKGHAPPLHVHEAEDEIWIVLDGEITFFVGDERHDLHAGAVAHGPRGVPHSYLVRSSDARMVVAFGPAGIEDWFAANSSPISDVNDVPASFDIDATVASAMAYRLRVAGPPPVA
ncbi:cupin domain-containing protein [Nonomuraea fuscirosea]|jgi:quercetin dioxygenase-like cupin family protein|uniref:cupin domain-containing protein n=1 Tax=Nonomuraea fuscirosea TaxID=1291556 RepID=UPI0034148378